MTLINLLKYLWDGVDIPITKEEIQQEVNELFEEIRNEIKNLDKEEELHIRNKKEELHIHI